MISQRNDWFIQIGRFNQSNVEKRPISTNYLLPNKRRVVFEDDKLIEEIDLPRKFDKLQFTLYFCPY